VWILWLLVTPRLRWPNRRAGLLLVLLATWGAMDLVRIDGVNGQMSAAYRPRWGQTPEEKYLADVAAKKPARGVDAPSGAITGLQPDDWPGFRGAKREGRLVGVRIDTNWREHPPQQVWRHSIGPGWSSFAVVGSRAYTQVQRGDDELVICYDAGTGDEIWAHSDRARFYEQMAGPGPRATPTFHEGKIYALGARGQLNCLDAATGKALWSRDIMADSGAQVPQWGFSSSPLVAQGIVTVFTGGPGGKGVLAYRASSGELAWTADVGQFSYCSPQLSRVAGADQVLIATDVGLTAFSPATGKILWQHAWPLQGMYRVAQPAMIDDSDVLLGTGFGFGTRRIHIARDGDSWTTSDAWTSKAIKPYFNDLVVHRGHIYGFDGSFFTCVSLENGKGKWRTGKYGNGQVLLLADQNLLLVISEKGEVALVEANPDDHKQLARFQALEGKTWNHPVIAHGMLFVRNGEEAACYRLAVSGAEGVADRTLAK
jgi:outer membrane protein assembly factor BamB